MVKAKVDIDSVLQILSNSTVRKILLVIETHKALSYSRIHEELQNKTMIELMSDDEKKLYDKSKNLLSYYFRIMKQLHMITKDEDKKSYFLTRLGFNCLELIQRFSDVTMEYDLNDINSEGQIVRVTKINGRKVVKL